MSEPANIDHQGALAASADSDEASSRLRWAYWVPVLLTVFISMGGMMSSNFLPKTLWASLAIAIGLGFCPPARPARFRLTPLALIWTLYMGWALASMFWAPRAVVVFDRWLMLLVPTLAYVLAARLRFWESDAFWDCFCAIVGLVAFIGFLQSASHNRWFAFLHDAVYIFPGKTTNRATLGHGNYASLYFLVTLPFLGWRFFRAPWRRAWIAYLAFGFAALFLLMARTRGAWLGALVILVFLVAAGARKRLFARKDKLLALLLPLLLLIPVAILLFSYMDFGARARSLQETIVGLTDYESRWKDWLWHFGVTDPWLGAGFGNFPIVATPTRPEVLTLNWEVHNDYLQAYVDLGAPGLALFTLTFAWLAWLGWRGRRDGLLLAAGASIVGVAAMQFTTWTSQKISVLVWLAGVAAILNGHQRVRPLVRFRVPRWSALALNGAAVVYLLVFAVVVCGSIWGDRQLRHVETHIPLINDLERKIEHVNLIEKKVNARGVELSKARVSEREGLRDKKKSLLLEMRDGMVRARKRALPVMWFDVNMIHVYCHLFSVRAGSLGLDEAAEAFAERALSLHPNDRIAMYQLSEVYVNRGDLTRAADMLEKVVDIFGSNPYGPSTRGLIQLYQKMGSRDRARALWARAARHLVHKPEAPDPPLRAEGVSIRPTLEWTHAKGAVTYEVYMWKERDPSAWMFPSRPVAFRLKTSEARLPEPLEYDTVYFWRVKVIGQYKEEFGDIWFFRTEKRPK